MLDSFLDIAPLKRLISICLEKSGKNTAHKRLLLPKEISIYRIIFIHLCISLLWTEENVCGIYTHRDTHIAGICG